MSVANDLNASGAGGARLPFNMQVVATQHLTLRAFVEDDIDPLYAIMADAGAMRYTYKAASREQCAVRLRAYAEQAFSLGYAPWTVLLRQDGRVIGWGGLNIDPFDPGWGTEVAYCLHPGYWGRGFGTEIVRASLDLGFDALGLATIAAFVHPENIGSARVLEKCGFQKLRYLPDMDRNYYECYPTR